MQFTTSSVTVEILNISFGVSRILVNVVLFCEYMFKCLDNRRNSFFKWAELFSGDEQTRLLISNVIEGFRCSQW